MQNLNIMLKIGINGYGRIGRHLHRKLIGHPDMKVVAVNSRSGSDSDAYLLKYDSLYGRLEADIRAEKGKFFVNDDEILTSSFDHPSSIPWKDLGVDIVIESTGKFTKYDDAKGHLDGGAKKVIISAPCKDPDKVPLIVIGVNEDSVNPEDFKIVSNASCTTNCLAPTLKVLNDNFRVRRAFVTAVHAYTKSQMLMDGSHHKDPRKGRSATQSIIPTSTGAMASIGKVIPELEGKVDGLAVRVPIATVSLLDIVCEVEKNTSVEELNKIFANACKNDKRGVVGFTIEPLVSADFRTDSHSTIIDGLSTKVINGNMIKILAWYDNEWGYTSRLVDLVEWFSK